MLIYDGQVFSCHEVYQDLQKQKDALWEWAKRRKKELFPQPSAETIAAMQSIMAQFTHYAAKGGGSTNASDPWVIAHAQVTGATVVTDESPAEKARSTKPPKMPNVCAELKVPCLRPLDFLRAIGLKLETEREQGQGESESDYGD